MLYIAYYVTELLFVAWLFVSNISFGRYLNDSLSTFVAQPFFLGKFLKERMVYVDSDFTTTKDKAIHCQFRN